MNARGRTARLINRDRMQNDLRNGSSTCGSMFAVVTERLLGDVRDAAKLSFGGAEVIYASRIVVMGRRRYSRFITASRGLLISCAMVAAMRPVAAIFSACNRDCSIRLRTEMSRKIFDAPIT